MSPPPQFAAVHLPALASEVDVASPVFAGAKDRHHGLDLRLGPVNGAKTTDVLSRAPLDALTLGVRAEYFGPLTRGFPNSMRQARVPACASRPRRSHSGRAGG